MINIYTLKGCSFCKEALANLDLEGILYTNIDADENSQLCDRIETALNTTLYPIVSITRGITTDWIISTSTEERVVRPDCSIDYFQSIPHLITLIKKRIH